MFQRRFSLLVFILLLSSSIAYAQSYKVATASAPPGGDVPQAVASAVEAQGLKFEDSQAKVVAEVWLAKSVAAAPNPTSSPDVLYGSVAPGTFVGVLQFPAKGSDFRGQAIKAGYYTLRYEWIPEDGNHMGVSQYRDFLLLLPAAKDTNPSQVLSFRDAIKLSRLSTGTGHPGVLTMDPVSSSVTTFPAAFQDDSQDWAIQAKASIGGKATPLAFVLVGQYQGG
jgi:hypothetical protein